MSVNNRKTVDVVHVVYLSIIFTGVVIWLVSYIFGGSTYAGSLLSFGGTLSSILLAVIAIIITLIDVAGQRNNILDVKQSVEELKNVTTEITGIIDEFEINNKSREENMLIIIQSFSESIDTTSKKFDEITEKLEKIPISGESKDELDKIKGDINKIKTSLKNPILEKVIDKNNEKSDKKITFADLYGIDFSNQITKSVIRNSSTSQLKDNKLSQN